MNDDMLNALKASMRLYSQVPAKDKISGDFILTNNRANPNFEYLAIEDFVRGLEKQGKNINATNLVITDNKPEVAPEAAPEPTEPEQPAAAPDKAGAWSEAELDLLPWADLRKLAGTFEDVSGRGSREEITAKLIGKPKSK